MLEAIKMYFFPSVLNVLTVLYIINKFLKLGNNLFKAKSIIIVLIWIVVSILNYIFVFQSIKFLIITLTNTIFVKIISSSTYRIIFPIIIIEQVVMFFSELIFYVLMLIYYNNPQLLFLTNSGSLYGNFSICLFALIIISNKYIVKICYCFLEIMKKSKKVLNYFIVAYFLITINILLYIAYYDYSNFYLLLINSILVITYGLIIYSLLNEKNVNEKFKEENQVLIQNLNEYEKMLDYQRVNNHENKNQLLVIKSMVEKEDKKAIEYINEIIKEKREDNELMYTKAKRIPSGGLQGLVYQKMLAMQENFINVILDVSSNVRKIDFSILSSKMNYDICRIMGIILDNAIEETIKFNRKEREIVISMYIDELFVIEVSNRIKDNIELDKIYEKGYTSKEKGHGYGLSLLKKIIDKNDNVINELKITNDIFTQIIKIKM